MAKKKKNRNQKRRKTSAGVKPRIAEIELSEEFVEGQRDMFCALYCAFGKECEWWRNTLICRLQAFGKYDRLFEQMLLKQFIPEGAVEDKDPNALTADDLQLHALDPKYVGFTGTIVPLGQLPKTLPAKVKPNCLTEVLLATVLFGMETGCRGEGFSIHCLQQEDGNWRIATISDLEDDACCLANISSEEMNKLAEAAGIDLGSIRVEILDEED